MKTHSGQIRTNKHLFSGPFELPIVENLQCPRAWPKSCVPGVRGRTAAPYLEEVARRLGVARNKNQALEILDEIRDDLLNGRLKINGAE